MASTQGLPLAQQPATGEATPIARIISDVIPPKIPGAPAAGVTPSTSSSSASPSTSSADPLQKLPPQPPSLRHPPPALAAHHRIMALNDQWKRGQVGGAPPPAQEKVPGIDAESSSSDEDEADSDDESDEDAEDESGKCAGEPSVWRAGADGIQSTTVAMGLRGQCLRRRRPCRFQATREASCRRPRQ